MDDIVMDLREASMAVYLVTNESVAKALSKQLITGATEIERLRGECNRLQCRMDLADQTTHEGEGKMKTFEKELTRLINRHSIENVANMPDFLLAEMICRMIKAMGPSINKNLTWHGCDSVPGSLDHHLSANWPSEAAGEGDK